MNTNCTDDDGDGHNNSDDYDDDTNKKRKSRNIHGSRKIKDKMTREQEREKGRAQPGQVADLRDFEAFFRATEASDVPAGRGEAAEEAAEEAGAFFGGGEKCIWGFTKIGVPFLRGFLE